MEDLQEKLSQRESFSILVQDLDVQLSEKAENIYKASIEVEADATYATFHYPANIIYKKYDQGWRMESCEWGEADYELNKYPKKSEIIRMLQESEGVKNTKKIDITFGEEFDYDQFYCRQENTSTCSKYAQGTVTNLWIAKYMEYQDNWEFGSTHGENINITLSRELEGKWALYNESDYLLIENVTDTALEVSYKGAKSVRLSVTDAFVRSDGGLDLTLEGHSDGLVKLEMTLPKDTYLSPFTGRYQDLGFVISITDGLHKTSSFVSNSSSKTNY